MNATDKISTVNAPVIDFTIDAPVAPSQPEVRTQLHPVFTGLEDHAIPMDEAGALTRNYRRNAGKGAIKGGVFSRASLEQILDQEGVVGLRYYYGQENNGRAVMVIVGVNEQGTDLFDGIVCERSLPCPPFCGPIFNPLNS